MKNKKTILLISILLLLVITILGVSYAAWDMYHVQSGENIVTTKCFEITSDLGTDLENTPITTSEFYPMSDEVGMNTTPFTFTITNVCDSAVNYQINLETLSSSTIDLGAVKATLNDKKARVLTSYTEVEKTISDASESRKLLSGKLGANESLTYNFRFWMDEKADNTTQNKSYAGKITVVGTLPRVMPVNNCTYEGELVQGAEYSDGTYTYRYMQEGGYGSSTWIDIEEDGWGIKISDGGATEATTPICTSINGKPIVSTSYMFSRAGYNFTDFDISSLDTSHVVNMSNMFADFGGNNVLDLGVDNFDVSSVRNMSDMFNGTGVDWNSFEIDLSSWDTSKVTNMSSMFSEAGYNATTWNIGDLSNWDTSSVTNMSSMFAHTGVNINNYYIGDLSGWDVSNVLDMSKMFYSSGVSSTTWNVGKLSSWDTSSVTNMSSMFCQTGDSSDQLLIDISSWDVSSVETMNYMFNNSFRNVTNFNLDLSKWNTSNLTNITSMFSGAGSNSTNFILNVSDWDTTGLTSMKAVFSSSGLYSTSWSVEGLSTWNTSNVTDMNSMFYYAGYSATNWNDIGTLTVYATNINNIFNNAPNAKATINIYSNPGTNYYSNAFKNAATASGSLITVNYSSNTTNINNIIATKSSNSNVVKGVQLD